MTWQTKCPPPRPLFCANQCIQSFILQREKWTESLSSLRDLLTQLYIPVVIPFVILCSSSYTLLSSFRFMPSGIQSLVPLGQELSFLQWDLKFWGTYCEFTMIRNSMAAFQPLPLGAGSMFISSQQRFENMLGCSAEQRRNCQRQAVKVGMSHHSNGHTSRTGDDAYGEICS